MTLLWLSIVIGGLIFAVAFYIFSRGRYYRRLFSKDGFHEFHQKLSVAIAAAQNKEEDQPPSIDDGTAFIIASGLATAVTLNRVDGGNWMVHISLSQPGDITTHSVCSRFAFFAAAVFGNIKGELLSYYTDTGVHHLVFCCDMPIVQQNFEATYQRFSSDYQPIPFSHEMSISDGR